MLTYSLDKKGAIPLYEQLYRAIKKDITIGILKAGEKLLSKRYLAKRLGISIVTVETSYQQLKAEGYIYSQAKKGFFVSESIHIIRPLKKYKVTFKSRKQAR